jgi:mannan endo-1,4-beta-mannosidase
VSPHDLFTSFADLTAFSADAGRAPAIVNLYQSWGPSNDSTTVFRPDILDQIRALGAMPMVTWESYDYTLSVPSQPAYALSNIIGGNFDSYISTWAQAAKSWGAPFLLRFDHEMNGTWWPWGEGTNGNTTGQYQTAWKHVHDLFQAAGAANPRWVWCPNCAGSNPLGGYYPGDAYTDWVGWTATTGARRRTGAAGRAFRTCSGPTTSSCRRWWRASRR